jgi:hypothetical protein
MAARKRRFERVPRILVKKYKKPVEKISTPIGELVWASNAANGAFLLLFCEIVNPKDDRVGISIWHALKSDSAQRDVLLAAALATAKYSIASRVKWAMQKAGKLSSIRNDAVHTTIMFDYKRAMKPKIVDVFVAEVRRRRMSSHSNIARVFRTAKNDFVQLTFYVTSLLRVMQDDTDSEPWPNRPKLRSKLT